MDDVASILERERDCMETLLFKLVEARLILESGDLRYLSRAAAELERARVRCREVDLLRATTADRHHPGATLRRLASIAEDPWPVIFRDHHDVLAPLVAEIDLTAHHCAELATTELASITERVPVAAGLRVVSDTSLDPEDELRRLAHAVALREVTATARRVRLHDLLTFLR